MKFTYNYLLLMFVGLGQTVFGSENPDLILNVYVHGTYPALRILRHKKSPIRPMIYAPEGLSKAKYLPDDYYFCKMAKSCHEKDNEQYNLKHIFLWGWHSSDLRPANRYNEGKKLHKAIIELVQFHKEKGYDTILVRYIGTSHGGNVVLNALEWITSENKPEGMQIEAILLGTPVQEKNRQLVNNPLVSRVYSFYSTRDYIQRIDMQGFHKDCKKDTPYLSARTFSDTDDVIQVKLTLNGSGYSHGTYRKLLYDLPDIMKLVQAQVPLDSKREHITVNFDKKH